MSPLFKNGNGNRLCSHHNVRRNFSAAHFGRSKKPGSRGCKLNSLGPSLASSVNDCIKPVKPSSTRLRRRWVPISSLSKRPIVSPCNAINCWRAAVSSVRTVANSDSNSSRGAGRAAGALRSKRSMFCHSLQTGHGYSGRPRRLLSINFCTSYKPVPGVLRPHGSTHGTITSHRRPAQKLSTSHFTSLVTTARKASGYAARTVMRTSLPVCSSKARPL